MIQLILKGLAPVCHPHDRVYYENVTLDAAQLRGIVPKDVLQVMFAGSAVFEIQFIDEQLMVMARGKGWSLGSAELTPYISCPVFPGTRTTLNFGSVSLSFAVNSG